MCSNLEKQHIQEYIIISSFVFLSFLVFSLWHIAHENEEPQADSLERQQQAVEETHDVLQ